MLGAFSYAFPVSWDYIPVFLVSLQPNTYYEEKVFPTDNSSEFVTLTDVVPDAILEIRYYGTYNFVGQRIDGYEEPIALLLPRPRQERAL